MSLDPVHTSAFAKVNLSLSVGPPREDGMHPIVSKMACIGLCDDLDVARLSEDALSRYAVLWDASAPQKTPIDWPITSDLAVRAHRSLESEVGHPLPVQMKLQKRIPVGGGLGGGSADAAAMLRMTAELFDLDLDLGPIAISLGSDIPFLLGGGTAIVTGYGQCIEPLEEDQTHLVLIMPQYGCPTGEVYDALDELGTSDLEEEQIRNGVVFNDLTLPACHVIKELARDRETLSDITGEAIHLSGSGSTMFVICDTAQYAETLAKAVEEQTECVAIATQTIVPTMELEKTE